jgi:hypothetical protein
MTRKLSISLPDDVAERLDKVDNVSAYIADAIRMKSRREAILQMLHDHGYEFTEEQIAIARTKWADVLKRGRSPESLARSRAKWEASAEEARQSWQSG